MAGLRFPLDPSVSRVPEDRHVEFRLQYIRVIVRKGIQAEGYLALWRLYLTF